MTRKEALSYAKAELQAAYDRAEKIGYKEKTRYIIVLEMAIKALEQESRWIPTSKKLPNKNQWVLVTTENYQKIAEVMCYQGMRIGQHDVGNGWEEYEYPSWTSGHGDIQSSHPKAWMPLPQSYKAESEE